ncbi:MAG TPA: cysteine desulfurase family protein [Syntrophomonadaceae bacterium]|nr:cysteine desulfurase family protein [Syntrophomonadaceae bacterium]
MSLEIKEVYLDNSATTPVLPDIADRMRSVMVDEFGNPSSSHGRGVLAEGLITESRKNISQALEVKNREIFFTSGGTESNNWALVGSAASRRRQGDHIICSSIEHPSVLEVVKYLGQNGFNVDYCPVNHSGIVDPNDLAALVGPRTILVSIMLVNNEIGSFQPIKDLVQACKNKNPNILFHSDCVQAVGKIQVYPRQMGVDLASMSAHKFHGPKGVGALFVKDGTNLRSFIHGGGQELGLRSGTENVPGIVGFSMAVKRAIAEQDENSQKMRSLKEHLLTLLNKTSVSYRINGPALLQAAPHIINLSFAGVRGEVLVRTLEAEKIYVSTGSACTSRKTKTSHVLKAIGLSDKEAAGSIRISLSGFNTREDMDRLAKALESSIKRLIH